MILVLTKQRHVSKIEGFLVNLRIEATILTPDDVSGVFLKPQAIKFPDLPSYSLGVSYCWPYLVTPPMLDAPPFGWVNYHPAPLPGYEGPKETTRAISDRVMYWGVTVHKMDEHFDTGPIIKVRAYPLWEPPTSEAELSAVAHWHLFALFKCTIYPLAQGQNPTHLASIGTMFSDADVRVPSKSV